MMLLFVILFLLLIISIKQPIAGLVTIIVCYPTISMLSMQFNFVLLGLFFVYIGYFFRVNKYKLESQAFPFSFAFTICLLSYFFSFIISNDTHIISFINRSREYILVFFLWKMFTSSAYNYKLLYRVMVVYTVFLTIYGIYEAFTQENVYIDYLSQNKLITSIQREEYVRFGLYRAQSLTIWCSAFGVASCMGMMGVGHYYFSRINKLSFFQQLLFIVFILLCTLGVLCCGTRSVFLLTAIGSLSFLSYFKGKAIKIVLPIILISLIIINCYEGFFQEILNSIVYHEESGGSSLELRKKQLETVLSITKNSYWLGMGLGSVNKLKTIYSDLHGAESLLFTTLIERGAFGILSIAILYAQICIWLIRNHQYKLIIIVIAYIIGKIMALFPGNGECYILLIIIPLYKYFNSNTTIKTNK